MPYSNVEVESSSVTHVIDATVVVMPAEATAEITGAVVSDGGVIGGGVTGGVSVGGNSPRAKTGAIGRRKKDTIVMRDKNDFNFFILNFTKRCSVEVQYKSWICY